MSQVTDRHPAMCQKQTASDRYEPVKTNGVLLQPCWRHSGMQKLFVHLLLNKYCCQIIDVSASSRVRFDSADITFLQRFMKRQQDSETNNPILLKLICCNCIKPD